MITTDGLLSRANLEIRYDRGFTYFDKSGALVVQLSDVLGPSFAFGGKPPEHMELRSTVERLLVRVSPTALLVSETGPTTAARLERVGSSAWDVVTKVLGVEKSVTRVGFRLTYVWPRRDRQVAQELLAKLSLTAPGALWTETFGAPTWAAVTAVTVDPSGGQTRRVLDVVEHTIDPSVAFPEELRPFFPDAAVHFDVDYVYPPTRGISHGHLRDFIRERWEAFQVDLQKVGERVSSLKEEIDEPRSAPSHR